MEAVDQPTYTVLNLSAEDVLADYRLAYKSRQASLIGRREVLTGKAKFGIFGDGKEIAQVAMAHAFQAGDIRSGYYRDQTMMFATGMSDLHKFFAQLYADTNLAHEPSSGGRQMNSHFATRLLDENGHWRELTEAPQSSADTSPTSSQVPRMTGLAQASKLYRNLEELNTPEFERFSDNGNEVVFGTIGDASTAEGAFWETLNAVGVLQVPLLLSVWDDNYGISVPIDYQTTKGSISELLQGYQPKRGKPGVEIVRVKGWDYPALVKTYNELAQKVRTKHVPVLLHVEEMTQPQGHSTSGSHERYKTKERLEWEAEHDGLAVMRKWLIEQNIITEDELAELEKADKKEVSNAKKEALKAYQAPIQAKLNDAAELIGQLAEAADAPITTELQGIQQELKNLSEPFRRDVHVAVRKALVASAGLGEHPTRQALLDWNTTHRAEGERLYGSHLYSESELSPLNVPEVRPELTDDDIPGFELLQQSFDAFFARYPNLLAFGEDLGYLGDVNQGMAGMQAKYGEARVSDTGIREETILGQGIGLAMRGLRPIAEIQYLDYLFYALQITSDDLATVRWRSAGGQKAPVIIRTRGHRLEGVWHSGSPMAAILGSFHGLHVCVPRNCTQAAGMYNTLLQGDDPALIIEVLNAYRYREPKPANIGEYTVPLGMPEVLREGGHITLVTYGASVRVAQEAAEELSKLGVELELIDVQTLLPFDREDRIVTSLQKTNRLVVLDEDVPGGASAYITQKVLERQGGYFQLDSLPQTITGTPHRPAYASDGDYFSKPNVEDVIERCYGLMHEFDPAAYPAIF